MARKTRRQGQKQCPSCGKWVKGTRTRTCRFCGHEFNGKAKSESAPAMATAAAEKPAKAADTVSLEQVKAVVHTVKSMGGAHRVNELLDLVRQMGGVRKFRDVVNAVSGPEEDETQRIDIPF